MRIVFDVSPLSLPPAGIGRYVRGTLAGLAEAAGTRHEIVAFALVGPRGLRAIPRALDGLAVRRKLLFLPPARTWRRAWSRLARPSLERLLGGFDVLHFSDWWFPPQRGGVRATTIHDLVPLHFPEWVPAPTRRLHVAKYAHAAATCDVVFANSRYTADDVAETLRIPRARIRVAYPGVAEQFRPDGPAADLGRPYLLTVATLEPRKNLETLVSAHRLLADRFMLAVVGGEGWGSRGPLDAPGVVHLGYVADEQLPDLYRGAAAFVYPSRFEGFGIPLIEALACGTPLVASSHPSMDEACGDAAVRADPDSAEALAAAIEDALARRDELVTRGLAHVRRFTWRQAGEVFLRGYEDART